MTHSETLNELATALAKAQAAMKPALRDSDNPHFKSRFSSLASVWEACREPLTANGLSVLQMPSAEGNQVRITTMLLHTSGEWVSAPLTMTARDASPQSVGSALTYCRRYGLQAVVGICPEDDDGEAATERHAPAHVHRPLGPTEGPRPPRPTPPAPANGTQRQYDGPPKTGRQLFAWTKAQEERFDVALLKELNRFGKELGYGGRMTEWSPGEVEQAHAAAMEFLRLNRSEDELGEVVHHEPDAGERG